MCGIVGYIGDKQAFPILMNGLRRLEYRGYDSAGVALLNDGEITVSSFPSTTLSTIDVKIGILNVIDTPGIVCEDSVINFLDLKNIKKLVEKKSLRNLNNNLSTNLTLCFILKVCQRLKILMFCQAVLSIWNTACLMDKQ